MRLSLRFIVPLAMALAAIAWAVVPLVDQLTLRWFVRDLDIRGELIANAMRERVIDLVQEASRTRVERYFAIVSQDERLYALGFCQPSGRLAYRTPAFPDNIDCPSPATGGPELGKARSRVFTYHGGPLHVVLQPIAVDAQEIGRLAIVHDMSFAQRRSDDTKRFVYIFFVGLAAVVSLITVIIAELSWRGWMAGLRAILTGESPRNTTVARPSRELRPFARDLQLLLREIEAERAYRDEERMSWTAEALRNILTQELKGDEVLIVSNREPYTHTRRGNVIEVQRPASGLVTALEPVMRACSGTWIAHGSGSADRDTVDRHDRVMVPPDNPAYRIRRVWLSKEEETGYYYGFANEGLWPLCHIAHTRPTFRAPDWEHYRAVNERFAEVVVQEARTEDPIVLVQDYHFALLPRMIRERLPRATIITFWHIPWPNPETFGICPWREEILSGMLGSSILGFHTQVHCNNFFDTVDRYLEARVDRDAFSISLGGEVTEVHRYPISIEWPPSALAEVASRAVCRETIRRELGYAPDVMLGVGVDRLDYTKGILERFRAVERFFELEPRWVGRFGFVQIAAPSRSSIEEYQEFEARVRAEAARINARYGSVGYQPIVLRVEHHDAASVHCHYRACDLCFVSSLHDGMNLVAKEFIAAREDGEGVLLLSQFAGAARELTEALIVNPYDVEQCAVALAAALAMPVEEQRARMKNMRALVQEFNVYRWAGRMLLDAARMRARRRIEARAATRAAA
ncbi:MAG: trehalose-6-phosphate synthase [Burkholderiales bacterium]|nr:trehalose-6-phosphate synthase [Burkholderiales bacterium]